MGPLLLLALEPLLFSRKVSRTSHQIHLLLVVLTEHYLFLLVVLTGHLFLLVVLMGHYLFLLVVLTEHYLFLLVVLELVLPLLEAS